MNESAAWESDTWIEDLGFRARWRKRVPTATVLYLRQNPCSDLFRSQLFSISFFLASAVNITMKAFLQISLQCCAEMMDAGCSELISRVSVLVTIEPLGGVRYLVGWPSPPWVRPQRQLSPPAAVFHSQDTPPCSSAADLIVLAMGLSGVQKGANDELETQLQTLTPQHQPQLNPTTPHRYARENPPPHRRHLRRPRVSRRQLRRRRLSSAHPLQGQAQEQDRE